MSNGFRIPEDKIFIIAEIGINHNGDVELAKKLVDAAADAGADVAKFQIRTPHASLPPELWNQERETPWGVRMTYLEYRQRIELGPQALLDIIEHCKKRGILFSASPWDFQAVNKLAALQVPFFKVASASLTNIPMLQQIANLQKPVVMSTGMSTLEEIHAAVKVLRKVPQLALLVCTAAYPAKIEDLNLRRIHTLKCEFPDLLIGYSGHEVGLWTSIMAASMGAQIIERHITLDRAMPGSDQAASVEPPGFKLLVRELRNLEKARGSGAIKVQECELPNIRRLRGSVNPITAANHEPLAEL